jgi:hypothetical protein
MTMPSGATLKAAGTVSRTAAANTAAGGRVDGWAGAGRFRAEAAMIVSFVVPGPGRGERVSASCHGPVAGAGVSR